MRAFIALTLPPPVREALAGLQQQLASAGADVGWVKPDQLHMTVKFLDDITEDQRRQVEVMLREVIAAQPVWTMALDHLGAFPKLEAPRILWVGAGAGREPLVQLARQIEQGAARLSLRREERPFSAHVTIGRVRSGRGLPELAHALQAARWDPPAPWPVESLTLYQSVLTSKGPTYTTLADILLIDG